MPHCRVPSRRFDLESLEHRLTPSTMSLPFGLSFFPLQAEAREHSNAPSFQSMNASSQMQSFSLQGLGNLFRQVLVVDLSVRISFLRIDFNSSFSQFSAQVSNLKTKVDTSTGSDQTTDTSGTEDNQPDSASRATPTQSNSPASSPATRQNQPVVITGNSTAPTNANTSNGNPAQNNAATVNAAGQTVTTGAERNALIFSAPGARNPLLAQDRFDTTTLPPVVNPIQLNLPGQLPIQNGLAAAPLRPQLTLPLNGGGNTLPTPPEQEGVIEEPVLPLNLEGADPVVPLLPSLLDQFLEDGSDAATVREWIFTAMPGNPFWAYALVAAAGSAGAGWLSTRRKEKRKGEPFNTDEEEDALTDGYPS